MELDTAKDTMTAGLTQCSYLAKTLTDIEARVGDDVATTYRVAVGRILAWFLFEVFAPLEHTFIEVRGWHAQPKEWTPDFGRAADRETAFLRIRRATEDTEQLGARLAAQGVVSAHALSDLRRWTREFISVLTATQAGIPDEPPRDAS